MGKELALMNMAEKALEEVKGFKFIGLGSGYTVARFVEKLAKYAKNENATIEVIPSSLQIQIIAEQNGLKVVQDPLLVEVNVDGADQVDENKNMIKGYGGALLKEKVLMHLAKKRIILIDDTKLVKNLEKPFPVEVIPFARNLVKSLLEKMGAKAELRKDKKGYPFITENGNLIIYADFGKTEKPKELELKLKSLPGVVEVGLFTYPIHKLFVANLASNDIKLISL
jgi:ribose 5-phosphate isomerase A